MFLKKEKDTRVKRWSAFEQPGPGTVKKQTVDKVLDVIVNFI